MVGFSWSVLGVYEWINRAIMCFVMRILVWIGVPGSMKPPAPLLSMGTDILILQVELLAALVTVPKSLTNLWSMGVAVKVIIELTGS